MRIATLLLSALLVGATLLALAPTSAAAGTCTSLRDDGCDYLFCYGYSGGDRCQLGVPDDWTCPGPLCETAAPDGVCVSAAKMDCGGWIVCASYHESTNTCKVGVHKSWFYCPGGMFCPPPW